MKCFYIVTNVSFQPEPQLNLKEMKSTDEDLEINRTRYVKPTPPQYAPPHPTPPITRPPLATIISYTNVQLPELSGPKLKHIDKIPDLKSMVESEKPKTPTGPSTSFKEEPGVKPPANETTPMRPPSAPSINRCGRKTTPTASLKPNSTPANM